MGFHILRTLFYNFRITGHCFHKIEFFGCFEPGNRLNIPVYRGYSHFLSLAGNTRYSGMNVLNVKNRIVVCFSLCKFQVKVQRAFIVARQENESCRVFSDFRDNVLECNKFTGPGRHGNRLSAPQQINQLNQNDIKPVSPAAGRLY